MTRAIAHQFFPSLLKLAHDDGLIGEVLKRYSWALAAADKWAEQDANYQEKHNDPNSLPLLDPWQYLIDAPAVAEGDKAVFRASQSQILAFRRLVRMAMGSATLKTDWQQEAVKARDKDERRSDHAANRLANALMGYSAVQKDAQKKLHGDAKLSTSAASWHRQRHAQLVHDGKRAEAGASKPLPTWKEIQERFPFETMLAVRWVRLVSDGPPGLMFWRNEALTEFLFKLGERERTKFPNLGLDYIKKTRQQLELIPVGDTAHLVWDVNVSSDKAGSWKVKGRKRNHEIVFEGIIPDLNTVHIR